MGFATRIDDVTTNLDGSISVLYSAGATPLPAAPMGLGLTYSSMADLQDAITEFESGITENEMLPYLFARWRSQDGTLAQTNKVAGSTMTADFSAPPGQVLKLT